MAVNSGDMFVYFYFSGHIGQAWAFEAVSWPVSLGQDVFQIANMIVMYLQCE